MRAYRMLILLATLPFGACGSDEDEGPFDNNGGTFAVERCGYSITTRSGAEAPRKAKDTFGADPTPQQVHLGLVGDPKTSIVAQWRTIDETTRASTMRWGVGADLPESALTETETETGLEFGYRILGTQIYRMHQVHLCGLEPGTTYSYQVGGKGHFSPVYSFTTAPDVVAHPDAEVVLGFVGDSRAGYDVWQELIGQLKSRSPDLILYSGDAVTVGITQFEWDEFLVGAEQLFARVPVVTTNGNHEANAANYYAQFALPGDQQNFGFDYGHAHITVGNDTPEEAAQLTTTTVDALRRDFEASKTARWKLLMHHQPMWSASQHGSNLTLQTAWQPLVDQYKLDLVVTGHEHEYEITKPLVGNQVQPSNDNATVYVVAGGAGAELYDNGTDFWTQYSEKTHSAAVIRVRRDQLALDPFRPDGTAIPGSFTKTRP